MQVLGPVFALLLSAASATAQLGPEMPVTEEPAQYPATIRAANHQLTAWSNQSTFEIRATLDGVPLVIGQSHEFATAPVLAANDSSFLIVWEDPEQSKLLGRRIAFDGSFLDAAPIDIGPASYYTSQESIAASAEGSGYLVWWATNRTLTVARITGSTSTRIGEEPWVAGLSTPQIRVVRVDEQTARVFYGDDQYVQDFICDPVSCWNGFFGVVEPNGAGSIRSTQLLGNAYQAGPIAVVSDGFQLTLLWWGTQRNDMSQALFAAQLSTDLHFLFAPKVVYQHSYASWEMPPALRAVWNGSEIVVAWSSVHAFRAIRLTRYADAIDPKPFDFAPPGDPNAAPSVTATDSGALFTYAVWQQNVLHTFTRTLDRLPPGPPKQRAVRH